WYGIASAEHTLAGIAAAERLSRSRRDAERLDRDMLRFEIGERVESRFLVLGGCRGTVRYSSTCSGGNCRNCSTDVGLDQLRRLILRAPLDVGDKPDEVPADLGGEAVEQTALRRNHQGTIAAGVTDRTRPALLVAARLER